MTNVEMAKYLIESLDGDEKPFVIGMVWPVCRAYLESQGMDVSDIALHIPVRGEATEGQPTVG